MWKDSFQKTYDTANPQEALFLTTYPDHHKVLSKKCKNTDFKITFFCRENGRKNRKITKENIDVLIETTQHTNIGRNLAYTK